MKTYTVTMESSSEDYCKRVKVQADNPYDAMAAAQERGNYDDWVPVEIVETK